MTTLADDLARAALLRRLIDELIADPRQLGPDYQPIRRLADDVTVAVKATGRGRSGTEVADTLALLDGARSLGLVERLDWTFRCLAFTDLAPHPDLELHLTPEPETFGTLCPPRLAATWSEARRSQRVAAELHADAFADAARLRTGLGELRAWGWRVVLADLGNDDDLWRLVDELAPDLVQIDVRRPAASQQALAERARDLGAGVMAVGVDTPAALLAARGLGAELGRGALFGAPSGRIPRP